MWAAAPKADRPGPGSIAVIGESANNRLDVDTAGTRRWILVTAGATLAVLLLVGMLLVGWLGTADLGAALLGALG